MPADKLLSSLTYTNVPGETMIVCRLDGEIVETFTFNQFTNKVSMTERKAPLILTPRVFKDWLAFLREFIEATNQEMAPKSERSSVFMTEINFDPDMGEVTICGHVGGLVVGITFEETPNTVRFSPRWAAVLKWSDFLRFAGVPSSLFAILSREYPDAF